MVTLKKKILLSVICILVCVGVAGYDVLRFVVHPQTSVVMLDIGQGDAFYIRLSTGEDMLIDSGANSSRLLRELGAVMPWWDHELNAVVLTHPDSDHIGGFSGVFDSYHVSQAFDCGYRDKATESVKAAYQGIEEHAVPLQEVKAGDRIDLSVNAWFDVLSPTDTEQYVSDTSNDCSLVMLFHDHAATMLFTGDASIEIENDILARYEHAVFSADVLKIGHHGSKNSTSDVWLDSVQPSIALISAGVDNRYNHPHPSVVEKLMERGIEIWLTPRDSTVECVSNREAFFCAPYNPLF